MNYEVEIRKIIAESIDAVKDIEHFDSSADLAELGADSISFVRIIVAIEDKFGIEFPEDKMIMSEIGSIVLLSRTVEKLIDTKVE